MKNKTIQVAIKVPSQNLQSEFQMQQADKNKKCKMSKSTTLPMISICLSLMIIIIPIIWFVFMCMTGDDKTLTSYELSDKDKIDPQRYGLFPDYSRSSDRYGYNVNSVKIPEYRNSVGKTAPVELNLKDSRKTETKQQTLDGSRREKAGNTTVNKKLSFFSLQKSPKIRQALIFSAFSLPEPPCL